ncbi:PROTEIN PHOSPHATASE 2C 29 [Salix purpurea]|uniref:PROTEIN PHOSPHATASE 2C 29 n=1 Tax=Salix purpurea TaxID=77065 RepID=A0A9Q0TI04_SALPP|nr:PROTEIN PHOSPHATASE 2C 29 [Salix purpurea]
MGSGFSTIFPCFKPPNNNHQDLIFTASEPLDETLGHSFYYVRSSNRFLSPTPSDRFLSPSHSPRFSPTRPVPETGFKSISGASVSANTSTPRTVQLDNIYDDATDDINSSNNTGGFVTSSSGGVRANNTGSIVNNVTGFESTASFTGATDGSGGRVHFSAPLGGIYVKNKKRRGKGISGIKKAIYRNISEKNRPWVVPVLNFVNRRENSGIGEEREGREEGDSVQWALGKAGEDRVHVVVSEEHGWLFVGIYDGFNGPDAPEFLMGNLYRAVFNELQGLFWEVAGEEPQEAIHAEGIESKTDPLVENSGASDAKGSVVISECNLVSKTDPLEKVCAKKDGDGLICGMASNEVNQDRVKKVTFQREEAEGTASTRRRRLWEFLAEDDLEDGLDLSGSDRFAFSVDDAISVGNAGSAVSRRWLLLSKLKQGLTKHKERKLFPWKFGLEGKEKVEVESSKVEERVLKRKWKAGPFDHELVLGALSRALEVTELATEAIVETRLTALQLSTDHSTSIKEEIIRIKNEHPDDNQCIVNDRVKGRLKVTRAFGAGFLKRPKLNDALLEMFRNEYIGTAPYISCSPSLHHHQLCPRDQFLVLSSDGLYQYLTNQEVVSLVESFMEKFPDGDPAQHLLEELLFRAARKAGMDFHELLDIPQGDRRKYHDDVTVMVISLEGRIWKSSGKYL